MHIDVVDFILALDVRDMSQAMDHAASRKSRTSVILEETRDISRNKYSIQLSAL
jgi:septal ring-binding cell division protein DamX